MILKNNTLQLDFIGTLFDIDILHHFSIVVQTSQLNFYTQMFYKINKLFFEIIPWRVFVVNCAQIWPDIMSMYYSTNCEGKCSALKTNDTHCTKKLSFPLKISSVNVTESIGNCGFGHIY